jgi:ribosome-binding protein aMBF1 (putative translation factor)
MKDDGRCPIDRDGRPCPTCELEAAIDDPERLRAIVLRQLTEGDTFGQRLRRTRQARGLTAVDLARRVDLSQATVSRWESNERAPTPETLCRLADMLRVDVGWLWRGRTTP